MVLEGGEGVRRGWEGWRRVRMGGLRSRRGRLCWLGLGTWSRRRLRDG